MGAQPVNDKPDTSAFTRPNSYVGRTLSRAGAKRAVAGRGRFTDDISLPRMLHAAFVRRPFAHARSVSIDTGEARHHHCYRLARGPRPRMPRNASTSNGKSCR